MARKSSSKSDRVTAYARAVVKGKIVAGPNVRNACRRHLDDLKRKDLKFDREQASRAIRFFETQLKLSEGQFEGRPFKSQPAQDFIIGSLFGWYRLDGYRRFRRAYVEQGKGNGKSPLAGGIGLYGLTADGEAGAEIYSAGATKEQAGILFRDAVKMVDQSPGLDKRIRRSGGPGREYNLAYLKNGSFFRPVSRETKKTGSGPRPHFALVDEVHEHPDGGIIEMLERGFKFRRQPLLFMITNSGSDRNSVAYAEHEWASKVAAGNADAPTDLTYIGDVLDDSTFSYICGLDGPRTERLEYNHAFDYIEETCTCRSVSTIQIERLMEGVCAAHVTCGGTDWRARLDALITRTDQSLNPASATGATRERKKGLRKAGQKSVNIKSDGSLRTKNESLSTRSNGSLPDLVTGRPKQKSKSSNNSVLPKTSILSLLRKMGNVLSAQQHRKDCVSTTATKPDNTEDYSASSVTLQSVYSETLRRVWLAHSNICEARKVKLDGHSLQIDHPADDPLNDPSCWVKANPLLGITITEEYLAGVVAQAKHIPSKRNGILRLHFCVWTDAETAWMPREVVEPLLHDFDPAMHKGAKVALGLDLSQNRDITAMGAVVRTGEIDVEAVDRFGNTVTLTKPTFDVWVEAWTPGDTLRARGERDKLPYAEWAEAGHIHAPPGESINYRHVAQTMVEYDRDYDVTMVAYDRYAFRRFEEDAADLGLSLPFVEHPQGGTKKGKPTPAMELAAKRAGKQAEGLWFPASLRLLEDAMLEGRVRLRRNPVLISAIMSAVPEQDKWDNAWLAKQKSLNKIDAAVAVVMAFGAANAMHIEKQPLKMFAVG